MTTQSENPVLETIGAITDAALGRSDLPADALLMSRIAAVDARPISYLAHVGPAIESGVTAKDVQNVLVAVAPIIGTARTMSAAINITEALGFAIAVVEDETE